MAVGARSCLVSSCKISHFGMKPVNGGRPPRDRRTKGAREVRAGVFAQEAAKELTVNELFSLKVRNAENVMMK